MRFDTQSNKISSYMWVTRRKLAVAITRIQLSQKVIVTSVLQQNSLRIELRKTFVMLNTSLIYNRLTHDVVKPHSQSQ